MFIKFMKYIHAEDIRDRDQLWGLYEDWMRRGKPAAKSLAVADRRVVDFVDTMCVVATDQCIGKTELYDIYLIFSGDVRGGSIFARELRALLGNKIIDHRPSKQDTSGKRPRYWKGVGLKA